MKKIIFPLLALSLIAGSSCDEKIDIEKEKEAIIAAIENESNSAHNKDFDSWSKSVLQDESLTLLSAGKGSCRFEVGWDVIGTRYKEGMENDPDPLTNQFQFTNFKIKVHKECAWVVYDEIVNNSDGEFVNQYASVRILEKVDGEWKIAYLSHVVTSSYEEVEGEESETED